MLATARHNRFRLHINVFLRQQCEGIPVADCEHTMSEDQMPNHPKDDTSTFPPLGRMLLWVDKPGGANKIFWALAALCFVLFLADFTYEKHSYFEMEHLPGFYGFFGFVSFTGLILVAKALREIIKRPENFYGDKAVDQEDYPASGLEKVDHDA